MSTINFYSSGIFSSRLQAAMNEKSFSAISLAEKSGVSMNIIMRYLNDEASPSLNMVELFAVALDIHPGWLAFGVGSKVAPSPDELFRPYAADLFMSASELDDHYNQEGDGEHPLLTRKSWIKAVADKESLLGYWEWVCDQLRQIEIK